MAMRGQASLMRSENLPTRSKNKVSPNRQTIQTGQKQELKDLNKGEKNGGEHRIHEGKWQEQRHTEPGQIKKEGSTGI